jgi:hypothetical protein
LCIGPNLLRECEVVVQRKAPTTLPTLAKLLNTGKVETCSPPTEDLILPAQSIVGYEPDAFVLAEAIGAEPDWFVTHDKEYFLKESVVPSLSIHVGTPGYLIQSIKDDFILP